MLIAKSFMFCHILPKRGGRVTRLTLIIFFLLFTALGYMAYLVQMSLGESARNKESLQTIALQVSQFRELAAPASQEVIELVRKKAAALDKSLALRKIADKKLADWARALVTEAKGAASDEETAPGRLAALESLILLNEVEKRLDPPMESSKAEAPPQKAPPVSGGIYKVQRGENLWRISKKFYRTPWRWHAIWKANEARIPNYRKMPSGFALRLPS